MLKGIKIKPICRLPDERGFFAEVMRTDWKDLFEEDTIAQANHSVHLSQHHTRLAQAP